MLWDCWFPVCFPNDHWLSSILSCACWPFRGFFFFFFGDMSTQGLCPFFLAELFIILLSSCRCLYAFWMPDPYPLYIICKYFSHSIGCLSPFLIVFFDAQKIPWWFSVETEHRSEKLWITKGESPFLLYSPPVFLRLKGRLTLGSVCL